MQFNCGRCGWQGEVTAKQKRCLACARRQIAAWRAAHPERARKHLHERNRRFRVDRREACNAKRRRQRARNLETGRNARLRRMEWLRAGDVTREQLIEIFEQAKGKCHYCQTQVTPRFSPLHPRGYDHVKPRAKDGRHTASNIVVCCRRCNELKADKEAVASSHGG